MTHRNTAARAAWMLVLLGILGRPAVAQSLAERIARAPDGMVRMSFAAREGVCGNGSNISIRDRHDRDWASDCEEGPVRVALTLRDHEVTRVKAYVGGHWVERPGVTDLGMVSAPAAAAYLLALAERGGASADEAIFPATIADSVTVWPGLLRIARNPAATDKARRGAIFWLGQAAGAAVTPALDSLVADEDSEVAEAAIFALSQRPDNEGVPALIRVARTHRKPGVRRQALFWLGQSKDPRALDLFEELLSGG